MSLLFEIEERKDAVNIYPLNRNNVILPGCFFEKEGIIQYATLEQVVNKTFYIEEETIKKEKSLEFKLDVWVE